MPFVFQACPSKDSLQAADGMVVLLPPSALSYGDAGSQVCTALKLQFIELILSEQSK